MYTTIKEPGTHPATTESWLKRIGFAGFVFFFLKGMLWLLIPWLAHSVFN